MKGTKEVGLSGCIRPSEQLRSAEMLAISVRKLLTQCEHELRGNGCSPGATEDAVELCQTIERLARWGRDQAAEQAVNVTLQIETLVLILEREVDDLLAS